MSTAFEHIAAAPVRHKRKGIPMRSPCQRDMVEAPGVVFRFPDKISSTEVKHAVPGLSILPSEAGLPSGHGDKSAAAVIAAAAAVSAGGSLGQTPSLLPSSTIIPAATACTPSTTIVTASSPTTKTTTSTSTKAEFNETALGTDSASTMADPSSHALAASVPLYSAASETPSKETISSASSTPILKPTASSLPIHRSASNVLHYPELLSDLRDKLIQVHQGAYPGANNASSGVDSDENPAPAQSIKRTRIKRASRSAVAASGSRSSPGPSAGPVGGRGSSVLRSTLRTRHELGAAAAAAAAGPDRASNASAAASSARTSAGAGAEQSTSAGRGAFHRRHSIGTIQSQAEDAEDSDIVVDGDESEEASAATTPAPQQQKQQQNLQQHQRQRGQVGAAAKHYMPEGGNKGRRVSAEADAGTPGPNKRKRDAKEAVSEQRGSSPATKRPALHQGARFSPVPSPAAGAKAVTSGVGSPFVTPGQGRRCCASCGAISTPCWRPGLIYSMTLCNQCGLRYKKGKVYCAKCSYVPTKTEIATGGANICKRCTMPIRGPHQASNVAALPSPRARTEQAEPRAILPGNQHGYHYQQQQQHTTSTSASNTSSSEQPKRFGF
ncbi:DNA-binding transcription repressor [Coemansia sp. RSA 485]|nr:DNA-binding transcription repressor [Coemansia sp. RSA 485]